MKDLGEDSCLGLRLNEIIINNKHEQTECFIWHQSLFASSWGKWHLGFNSVDWCVCGMSS